MLNCYGFSCRLTDNVNDIDKLHKDYFGNLDDFQVVKKPTSFRIFERNGRFEIGVYFLINLRLGQLSLSLMSGMTLWRA